MSKIYLDIVGRFDSAFGFFVKNTVPRVVGKNPYQFSTYQIDDPEFEDITLSYSGITLNFASKPFFKSEVIHLPFSGGDVEKVENLIAPPPIISFSRKKKLITTPLSGENTEVVERWNTDAWDINMRGILIDVNNRNYPGDLIRTIAKLFEYNDVVDVSGRQFYEKDISYIYFTDVKIEPVQGYMDTVKFSLHARSINDVGFTLLNNNG